jgi:hypothetical protein
VYLYLLTIFGGAVAGLVALTIFLFNILRYFISGLVADARYFQFLGWTVPTMLVAGAVWAYHQKKAQEESELGGIQRFSARRVLLYLMSFIGLGALIAGLIMLMGILLDFWINAVSTGPIVVKPGWWYDQLALSLALLIVAIPVWYFYWNQVIRLVAIGGVAEWRARSRRIFLYVILGASVIALTAAMVNIIYQLLNGALLGTFGVDVLRKSKWSLQTLVVAVPVLTYHLSVLRQDQRRGAEIITQQKAVTVLAGEQSTDLIMKLERELGYPVRLLNISPGTGVDTSLHPSDDEIKKLASDIRQSPAKKIMLVAAKGNLLLLPYEEK